MLFRSLHFVYEIWRYTKNDAVVPTYMKGIWEEYIDHVEHFPVPAAKRHQLIHEGHCSFVTTGERRFVTPEMIEGTIIVGGPADIVDKLRAAEAAGLREVSLLPPLAHLRETARDFAEQVIPRL